MTLIILSSSEDKVHFAFLDNPGHVGTSAHYASCSHTVKRLVGALTAVPKMVNQASHTCTSVLSGIAYRDVYMQDKGFILATWGKIRCCFWFHRRKMHLHGRQQGRWLSDDV